MPEVDHLKNERGTLRPAYRDGYTPEGDPEK